MIGEWCEGGFDGHYLAYQRAEIEVQWDHLLLMRQATQHDAVDEVALERIRAQSQLFANLPVPDHDTLRLIRDKPHLFGTLGKLKLLPFGEASLQRSPRDLKRGYLAFDPSMQYEVVFIADAGDKPIRVADSFRQMMLGARFVFYG